MTKQADDDVGRVFPDGTVSKPLTNADRARIEQGTGIAAEILSRAGADRNSIVNTVPAGSHAGGTAAIGAGELREGRRRRAALPGRGVPSGGLVAVAAHGRSFYREPIEAAFRAVPKRYVIGYRIEFWPRNERAVGRLLRRAGLSEVETKRVSWVETHPGPAEAYSFFSGTGGTWWLSKFPAPAPRKALSRKIRDYFERNRITHITQDVVLAYGVRRSGT